MKVASALDQLGKRTEAFVQATKEGRKNRPFAISIYDLLDEITKGLAATPCVGARIVTETEQVLQLARVPNSQHFYEAWQAQRNAIAEARTIITSKETA